jgi:Xaa-Pro aminopeptidase
MRQTYDVIGGPEVGRASLPRLRAAMKEAGLDGLYIPHEDEYQNEYLPACYERLAWATGFTGSAGAAFIFQKSAIVFVDGRYTLQVKVQLAPKLFEVGDLVDPGPFGWLAKQNLAGQKIGYDPRLISPDALDRLADAAKKAGADLVATDPNPVDVAWTDRPAEPIAPVVGHELAYTGESSSSKRTRLGKAMQDARIDAAVLTSPASLAWLFNIRGGDVSRTPLPLGRAILYADGQAELFLRPEKIGPELGAHLGNEVALRPISEMDRRLAKLSGKTVSLDPSSASAWFFNTLGKIGADIQRSADPCMLPREEECGRDRRRPQGASARWRCSLPLPPLVRCQRPDRRGQRDRRGEEGRGIPRANRRAEGPVVQRDLQRRAERRDQPLSPGCRQQPQAGARHAVPARFRRPVSRRHDGCDPHRRHRRTD